MAKTLAPMTETQWFDLFEQGLRSLGNRLPQALRLNDTGEEWIRAQLSLYAWYQHDMEIWSGDCLSQELPGCLFTHDGQMAVEIKYLRNPSRSMAGVTSRLQVCSANDSGIGDDVQRLKSLQGYQHRFMVLVSNEGADNSVETDLLMQNAPSHRQFAIEGKRIRVCRV